MKSVFFRVGVFGAALAVSLSMTVAAAQKRVAFEPARPGYPNGGVRRSDGTTMYQAGRSPISIGVRPGRFAIIELPYGETIVSKALFDPVRWEAPDSAFGTNLGNRVAVVKEKSSRTDISTQLVLLTNGSTGKYVVTIHAMWNAPESGTSIGFYAGRNYSNHSTPPRDVAAAPGPSPQPPCSQHDGRVFGGYAKPVTGYNPSEVYADGDHECIVMPAGLQQLPIVLAINDSSGQDELINYRFINNAFVVDGMRRHLVLMLGTNQKNGRVNVVYEGPRPESSPAASQQPARPKGQAADARAVPGNVSIAPPAP